MTYINKQWLLDQRPKGMPGDECWKLNEVEVPALKKGEVLIKILYLSIDPLILFSHFSICSVVTIQQYYIHCYSFCFCLILILLYLPVTFQFFSDHPYFVFDLLHKFYLIYHSVPAWILCNS